MDRTFLQERIARTKMLIVAYEDAVDALGQAGGVVSYTLDTGQSRQVVTRQDIGALNRMLDSLYNRLSVLQHRLDGGNVSTGAPAW